MPEVRSGRLCDGRRSLQKGVVVQHRAVYSLKTKKLSTEAVDGV